MNLERNYLHFFIDSSRWRHYKPRNSDIIIATPFKSGTTWMQMIILGLLHGVKNPPLLTDVAHWIDFRLSDEDEMLDKLESQNSRRFIKTHLPFDAIPYNQHVKYIVVDRDPRDVFMSLWNHYSNMNVDAVNSRLPSGVKPIPACPADIHTFLEMWLTRGYFDWEVEGYPFWSNFRHVQSWFDVRNYDNILHVHYKHLLQNSASEIKKIAGFIGVDINDSELEELAHHTSFLNTKKNLDTLFPGGYKLFDKGAETFFYKGTNGRWETELRENELSLFDTVSNALLSKACHQWLTSGEI